MKKNIIKVAFFAALTFSFGALTSCGGDDENDNLDNETMQGIATQFVNHTVIPTYTNLADYTEQLVVKLQTLKATPNDENVAAACETFLEARAWWEKSEAFLFGPASDFGIDPHIDSWPLDVTGFNTLMSNTNQIEEMDGEDGDAYAGDYLGNQLLGFHGIEYILFENGHAKAASSISDLQLIYAIAVAGDLRNRCYQLEASWKGIDNVAKNRQDKLEDLELNVTVGGGDLSYGENMAKAGQAGSIYASHVSAMFAIVDGCKTIADEVGTSKIGKPHNGEDPNYIESPYSQKSIIDFYNNIVSIENVYYGGIEGQRDNSKSLHQFIASKNANADAHVVAAIKNALDKINAMKAPFVNNITDASAGEAMKACQELDEALSEINDVLRNLE